MGTIPQKTHQDSFDHGSPPSLRELSDRLVRSIAGEPRIRHVGAALLPSNEEVARSVELLRDLIFPGYFGLRTTQEAELRVEIDRIVAELWPLLTRQISGALRYELHLDPSSASFTEACQHCDDRARAAATSFLRTLPTVRSALSLDVQAAYDGDPACRHTDEAVFSYPGVHAVMVHRLAHELYRLDVPLLPRMMSELAHRETGIDLHPGSRIGRSFFIDHGTGVVVGETTIIGDHCTLYQGVTLGAKSFPRDERGRIRKGIKRHPTLEDHVTVYAGATILGGDTVIGAGSVVAGGVFLTRSVPPGRMIHGPRPEIGERENPQPPPPSFEI